MNHGAMRICPVVLVHLRIALLNAASVTIEDLGTLTCDIEGEIEQPHQPYLASKRAAYHALNAAHRKQYELQETVGLPGEELREYTLQRGAQQKLMKQVLLNCRREAELVLRDDQEISQDARREVTQRVDEITAFLRDGHRRHVSQRAPSPSSRFP